MGRKHTERGSKQQLWTFYGKGKTSQRVIKSPENSGRESHSWRTELGPNQKHADPPCPAGLQNCCVPLVPPLSMWVSPLCVGWRGRQFAFWFHKSPDQEKPHVVAASEGPHLHLDPPQSTRGQGVGTEPRGTIRQGYFKESGAGVSILHVGMM